MDIQDIAIANDLCNDMHVDAFQSRPNMKLKRAPFSAFPWQAL